MDGNLISDAIWTCTWDGENRLTALQQQSAGVPLALPLLRLEFGYDAQSRRAYKRVLIQPPAAAGQSARPAQWQLARQTRFWYDGWNLMAEMEQSPSPSTLNNQLSTTLRTYTWGTDLSGTMSGAGGVGGLLGVTFNGGTTYAVCTDANGNVMGLINGSTGNLAARWDYDAFGNQLTDWAGEGIPTAELCPVRFSSKYQDAESGWLYYGYRYYAPEIGRWLSKDPLQEEGGGNLYGFVGNNSVNETDYLGLDFLVAGRRRFSVVGIPSSISPATHLFIARLKGCALAKDVGKEFEAKIFQAIFGADKAKDAFDLQPTVKSRRQIRAYDPEAGTLGGGVGRREESVYLSAIRQNETNGAGRVDHDAERYQILYTGTDDEVERRWKAVTINANNYPFAEHNWQFSVEIPVVQRSVTSIRNWPNSVYEWNGNNSNTFGKWLGSIAGHQVSLDGIGNPWPEPQAAYRGMLPKIVGP